MENLKSYLDGELDIAQQAEVETHLRNDAELQKMVEEFSTISSTLKTADSGEPYGLDKLEARLKAAPQAAAVDKKNIWRLATYWSGSMACLALATLLFFPIFAQSKSAAKSSRGANADTSTPALAKSLPPEYESRARSRNELTRVAESSQVDQMKARLQSGGVNADKSANPIVGESYEKSQFELGAGSGKQEDTFKGGDGKLQEKPSSPDNPSGTASTAAPIADSSDSATPGVGAGGGVPAVAKKKSMVSGNERLGTGKLENVDQADRPTKSEPENNFKSGMRAIKDKTTQPVTSIGDDPHGIYLERAGQVQVKVDDLMRAVNEATGMVQGYDGFVTASDLQNQADGGTATMTIRVPTKNFNAALDKLQSMGEVLSVNSNSQDITSETVDHSARMLSWADEEDRLVKELEKAKDNNHKLQIRSELRNVRANLESQRAEVKSLTERAKYSTINVSFVRGDKAVKAGGSGNWSGDALKGAKDNLSSVGQVLGTMGIYFLVFAPIWLPFAIAAYIIRKKSQ